MSKEAKKEPKEKKAVLEEGKTVYEGPEVVAVLVDEEAPEKPNADADSTDHHATDDSMFSTENVNAGAQVSPPKPKQTRTFGAAVGWGRYDYDEIESALSFGLSISTYENPDSRMRYGGTFLYRSLRMTDQVKESFPSAGELAAEINGRVYATPRHTLAGLYLLGGLEFGLMFFDFANPVEVGMESGSVRTVKNEAIWTMTPRLGAGVSILQSRVVHLGGNLTGGVKLFYDQTLNHAFENDFFHPAFFLNLGLEVSFVSSGK